LSLELDGRLFTDLEADFSLKGSQLIFNRFKSAFYGGQVLGTGSAPLTVDFEPPGAFEGRLEVVNGDLKHIIGHEDYSFRDLAGRVNGNVGFKGEQENPHRTEARGEVMVDKGSLFELPLFGDLARLIGTIFSTEPPTFTGGKASFVFREGVFALENVELDSTLMQLEGGGILTLDGVDLKFIPSTNIVPTIPIIGHIWDLIKGGLLTFKISGPYGNLNVTYEHLVNRIFTGDDVPDEPRYMGRIDYQFSERF
jgi:hypothetical protein